MIQRLSAVAISTIATILVSGCGRQVDPAIAVEKTATKTATSNDDEHGHTAGGHGGLLVSIGADNYHAEAVFENGGTLRLYLLDRDAAKVVEVQSQTLKAFVKTEGYAESVAFTFNPDRQPEDAADKTSVFAARLPARFAGKSLVVTVPSIRIGTDRFRFAFNSTATEAHKQDMPAKVANDAERTLYLTPGGLYTEGDIKANGNVTASQKFAAFKASHDLKPKLGAKICPVTMTKANPQCTWIIGGKTYEFCCPPCVDEFVQLAKQSPKDVKAPEAYMKK